MGTRRRAWIHVTRAEEALREVLGEPPSRAERLADRLGSAWTLGAFGVVVVGWCVLNVALAAAHGQAFDPAPFRWLQRLSILTSVIVVSVVARARALKQARAERLLVAQRELMVALQRRTLRVAERTLQSPFIMRQ